MHVLVILVLFKHVDKIDLNFTLLLLKSQNVTLHTRLVIGWSFLFVT